VACKHRYSIKVPGRWPRETSLSGWLYTGLALILATPVAGVQPASEDSGPQGVERVTESSSESWTSFLDDSLNLASGEPNPVALGELLDRWQAQAIVAGNDRARAKQRRLITEPPQWEHTGAGRYEIENGRSARGLHQKGSRAIGACGPWDHTATYGMSISMGIAANVLAAVNWACEETIGGFNSALACAVPNGVYQGFASLVEVGSFCNESNEHDDQVELSEEVREVGRYVGQELDEELGSRASAVQGQQAQEASDTIQSTLDAYFPVYFPLIEQRQGHQADQVAGQSQQLTDLRTRLANLQQEQRLLLARLEDINRRAADIQQENSEIRTDTQASLGELNGAGAQIHQLDMNLDARLVDVRQIRLAMQLSDLSSGRDFDNALPIFQGGRLERVREMVYQSLLMAQAAGFAVTDALARFAVGDASYNQGDFRQAYTHYAAAYQLITGPELPGGGF